VPKSLLKLLLGMIGMLLAASVSALGMGGIQVTSALGQPLKAEIELFAVGKAEKASLVARLASPDAYSGAGLEYPHANKYVFKLDYRPNGTPFLAVTSEQPVNDPFVSLLVDLNWASGRLLREYTFLLDPPGYQAAQPEPVAAAPVALPEAPLATPAESTQIPAESAVRVAQPAEPAAKIDSPSPVEPTLKKVAPLKPLETPALLPVTVQRGDTLRSIATRYKPEEVSLERMLVALYRVNARQFEGKNMNRIRSGKILRLPDADALAAVEQAAAVREIRAQVSDWNAYRQQLASAAPASVTAAADGGQVASGKISSAVADQAPVARESAKEVLKLSKGEAPGDQVSAATGKATPAEQADAARENRIADKKALEDDAARKALLEKNLDDMRRLAELKSEMAALTQGASAPAAASAVQPAPPVKKPRPVPPPAAPLPEPTFIDMLLEEPLYLATGAAVILLGGGGLGYSVWRRRKQAQALDEEIEFDDDLPEPAVTPASSAPVAANTPDAGDFTHVLSGVDTQAAAEIDPLSEADLYLNFGRYAQAEKILKEALARTPADSQLLMKLLGVYAASKNLPAFAGVAERVRTQLSAAEWAQVQVQGRALEPGNPLYADMHKEDAASATQMMATPVMSEKGAALDFDLGAIDAPLSSGAGAVAEKVTIPAMDEDADLNSLMAAMGATHLLAGGTGEPPETELPHAVSEPVVEEPSEAAVVDKDAPLAFDIDFKLDEPVQAPVAAKSAEPVPTIPGLGEISLSLEDVSAANAVAEEEKPQAWYDVQTKLDLARAYREMGDLDGAREVLEEALREGDDEQQLAARGMLDQLK